jgi:uncharacterized peroxidase-related enzyme
MPHIPFPPEQSISQESAAILAAFQEKYGRPSHIFRAMSQWPPFLNAAWTAWRDIVVIPGSLERWVKEAVVVITCSTQGTEYCVQGHSHALRREGLSEEQVAAIRSHTFTGFKDPELSIFRFAHKAAAAPKTLTVGEYDNLRRLGLSDATILEILAVVWVNTAMNMIVDALGLQRTAEQLKELGIR